MQINRFLRCVTVCAIAVPLHALAEPLNAKPGAWEMTITSATTARAEKPTTDVSTSCVTKEDLDQDRLIKSDDDDGCTRKVIAKTKTRLEFELTCAGPHASTSKVKVEVRTPESLAASMDIVQGGNRGRVHVDIKGRWLGASCAGIKD